MTTRIHTQVTLFGLACEAIIEADSAQAARHELETLTGGAGTPAADTPKPQATPEPAKAEAQSTPAKTAPAATQSAPATPSAAASAPTPDATASATTTPTPNSQAAPTPPPAAAEQPAGESIINKARELLGREGGEAYLQWALGQVGAATVGTTPADKQGELLQHIKTGLGEA